MKFFARTALDNALKRALDLIMAIIALVLLALPMLLIGLMIQLNSKGPVFYRGERVGRAGKRFRIFKFRTMVENADQLGGPSTARNDRRLTKIGTILRKYKIDEIPQIFNIIRGDMSFVGPRPQVERYTRLYTAEEKIILTVRPGLTDYASIRFINLDKVLGDEAVDDKYLREIEPEKNRLRVFYAQNRSVWIDLQLIVKTVIQLFRIRSLWNTED